jgi:hypothetical protein
VARTSRCDGPERGLRPAGSRATRMQSKRHVTSPDQASRTRAGEREMPGQPDCVSPRPSPRHGLSRTHNPLDGSHDTAAIGRHFANCAGSQWIA